MDVVLNPNDIGERHKGLVGGKAWALATFEKKGLPVPRAVIVTTEAYEAYLRETDLRGRISMEIHRKRFEDMRWEELWDLSLRIRNMFLNTSIPGDLYRDIATPLAGAFGDNAVVVRSSAPGEDSAGASFAGLHESFVNIRGIPSILEHIKRVWISLWSDRALLYRRELGLHVDTSAMAVLVQELIVGEKSGVVFGKNPNDSSQAVIEAVHGMNQGLVDGAVEPDRWILDRKTGKILSHVSVVREQAMAPVKNGVGLIPVPEQTKRRAPLLESEVAEVFNLSKHSESCFGSAQDVEWTYRDGTLILLQSRPITTERGKDGDNERRWYLSLHRTFENLSDLQVRIERELLPAMDGEATQLAGASLQSLSNEKLADEIETREAIYRKWQKTYWDDFIPMAHGIRLFGEVYNNVVTPTDPYEFMTLLGDTGMVSLRRNNMLEKMATLVRQDKRLAGQLRAGDLPHDNVAFQRKLQAFTEEFGDLSCAQDQCVQGPQAIIRVVLNMASHEGLRYSRSPENFSSLKEAFLARFRDEKRDFAEKLLALGRASYRLRDDDNIYIGRIKSQVVRAVTEGKARLQDRIDGDSLTSNGDFSRSEIVRALRHPDYVPVPERVSEKEEPSALKVRQLVGQPAGPGVGQGPARVVLKPEDLVSFEAGEVLVCDALDPTMTFVVPLSEGIVERRGGMLIHGAIIAREYGLPCITGVPEVTDLIRTGDHLVVDGYLGIVKIKDLPS